MKKVGSPMAVRSLPNISVAKVESSFRCILILDSNDSKVSGLTIWRGDGRHMGKKTKNQTTTHTSEQRTVLLGLEVLSSLWNGF